MSRAQVINSLLRLGSQSYRGYIPTSSQLPSSSPLLSSRSATPLCTNRHFSSSFFLQDKVNITFIQPDGTEKEVAVNEGENVLEIAHAHHIDLEGACEGSLACSTCHIILPEEVYDRLEEPTDEEYDMLDLAYGLTETSRLGCQVIIDKEWEGVRIELPKATRNMAVDGYKPKPH